MRRFFIKDYKTLKDAIGVEPPGQIFMNAIRKLMGRPPKHWNEELAKKIAEELAKKIAEEDKKNQIDGLKVHGSQYERYCYQRAQALADKPINAASKQHSLALVWNIKKYSDEEVGEAWKSIQNQSVAFDRIVVVGAAEQNSLLDGKVDRYESMNKALTECKEAFVFVLKDAGRLHDEFVKSCKFSILENTKGDIYYICDDKILADGKLGQPKLKPQFNQYLLYNSNYIGCNILIKRVFGEKLKWFDDAYADAYVYDFILRAFEKKASIFRIDEVLLHRTENNTEELLSERKDALQNHLNRINDLAKVVDGLEKGSTRLQRSIRQQTMVSIIIPFRDQVSLLRQCVESILEKTLYDNYEILLANNGSVEKETRDYLNKISLEDQRVKALSINIPFNFSRINNIATKSCK